MVKANRCLALLEEGVHPLEIAAQLALSKRRVYQLLKLAGIGRKLALHHPGPC
jgi:DNA-binding CsgD family transcriptional regulator